MTYDYFCSEPPHKIWFKKEQGRFLKKARLKAGFSVRDMARKTGVDIRWVESGEVNLQARNLVFLVRLYRVPEHNFTTWERHISVKLRKMAPPRLLH